SYTLHCPISDRSSMLSSSSLSFSFVFYSSGPHRDLHSFPTRRSSDLTATAQIPSRWTVSTTGHTAPWPNGDLATIADSSRTHGTDRKSTRLNSSHVSISYAVFCLKKKKSN